jgi:hypothetical protein
MFRNDQAMNDLAERAARDEPGARIEWQQVMEVQLAPLVRRALRQAAGADASPWTPVTERIVATARRLHRENPSLAVGGREALVKPVAHVLAETMLQRSRTDLWITRLESLANLETVCS